MFTLNCKGRLLVVDKPVVMGIINITPDSFYSESRRQSIDAILVQAGQMLEDGATIIDIGGQSTRPGSSVVTTDEELQRVITPIEAIAKQFPEAFISIDTYYSRVASLAVDAGASIVNDISTGSIDQDMIATVARAGVPYVLMHMKGTPQTMQDHANYGNVTTEVLDFFISRKALLDKAGIKDIIVDPGFGFSKTVAHNFELLEHLDLLKVANAPILLGISRKGFIYKTLGIPVSEAMTASVMLQAIGIRKGASIIRTHDVKETVASVKLIERLTAFS